MVKHGDVLMSMNGKLLPKIICWFTGAKRSHAGIVLEYTCPEGIKELFFFDAAAKGVKMQPLKNYLKKGNKDLALLRPKQVPYMLSVKAQTYEGRPYGFLDLLVHHPIYIIQEKLKSLFNKRPNSKRRTRWIGKSKDKAVVCTELIALVYDLDKPYRFTPKMLEESKYFIHKWEGTNHEILNNTNTI